MILVLGVWAFVRALLGNSAAVSLENVVLRHQLAVLQRSVGRPRLRRRGRRVWGGLSPPAFLSRLVIGVPTALFCTVQTDAFPHAGGMRGALGLPDVHWLLS